MTSPTVGFNVETVTYPTEKGTLNMKCWDVGGFKNVRSLMYKHYLSGVEALIWVDDSSHHERLEQSVRELCALVSALDAKEAEIPGSPKQPILILANKRDLPNVLGVEEINKRLASVITDRPYRVFPTSLKRALRDSGFREALTWLKTQLQDRETILKINKQQTRKPFAVSSSLITSLSRS
ncbi:ARF/SAR superfamily [Ramaria rubella]|nr:ARF/SAR superfamily [Ramaria rubella]